MYNSAIILDRRFCAFSDLAMRGRIHDETHLAKMMAILMAVFLVCTTLVLAGGAEAVSALAEADGNTPEVTDGADAQQSADNSGDIIIGEHFDRAGSADQKPLYGHCAGHHAQ